MASKAHADGQGEEKKLTDPPVGQTLKVTDAEKCEKIQSGDGERKDVETIVVDSDDKQPPNVPVVHDMAGDGNSFIDSYSPTSSGDSRALIKWYENQPNGSEACASVAETRESVHRFADEYQIVPYEGAPAQEREPPETIYMADDEPALTAINVEPIPNRFPRNLEPGPIMVQGHPVAMAYPVMSALEYRFQFPEPSTAPVDNPAETIGMCTANRPAYLPRDPMDLPNRYRLLPEERRDLITVRLDGQQSDDDSDKSEEMLEQTAPPNAYETRLLDDDKPSGSDRENRGARAEDYPNVGEFEEDQNGPGAEEGPLYDDATGPPPLPLAYDMPPEWWWSSREDYLRWRAYNANNIDRPLRDGPYLPPGGRQSEMWKLLSAPDGWCPNWRNPRPVRVVKDLAAFQWKIVGNVTIPRDFYGRVPTFPTRDPNDVIRIGRPWVPPFNYMSHWGVVGWWNPEHRFGRVVLRGTCANVWEKHPDGGQWYLRFIPTHFVGNTNAYYNAIAQQQTGEGIGMGETLLGRDPRAGAQQWDIARSQGWDEELLPPLTRPMVRALREHPKQLKCQLRGQDFGEARIIPWASNPSLRCHLVSFDLVVSAERAECRNARLIEVRRVPNDLTEDDVWRVLNSFQYRANLLDRQWQGDLEHAVPEGWRTWYKRKAWDMACSA